MPEGLNYVSSWIGEGFVTCWQVMETDDPSKFQVWILHWDDLAEFQVFPVLTSAEVRAKSEADGWQFGRRRLLPCALFQRVRTA
jgi:hypothetical protein